MLPLLMPDFASTFGACSINPNFAPNGTTGEPATLQLASCAKLPASRTTPKHASPQTRFKWQRVHRNQSFKLCVELP